MIMADFIVYICVELKTLASIQYYINFYKYFYKLIQLLQYSNLTFKQMNTELISPCHVIYIFRFVVASCHST